MLGLVACRFLTSAAPSLPVPDAAHASYILPIGGGISGKSQNVVLDEIRQLGVGSLYHRGGWSNVFSPWSSGNDATGAARLADSLNIQVGVIYHHRVARAFAKLPDRLLRNDIRQFQWRLDGKTWSGGTYKDQLMNSGRNFRVPSDSRMAKEVRRCDDTMIGWWAREVRKALDAYPGRIVAVNYVVEEELPTAGEQTDSLLGDYSPYAIAEFRDWLRHRGIYDDSAGAFKGEGAPGVLVGAFEKTGQFLRSPFFDDPSPAIAKGTHKSFNQTFGTNFTTWKLSYWDLDSFPAPLTDTTIDLSPDHGTGAVPGGFDAPRKRDVASAFWNVWSWDVLDHGTSVTGLPATSSGTPAFGFRQILVRHYLDDQERILRAAGIPANLLFRHQIPGEIVSAGRLRSSASPAWTGSGIDARTVGITHFGTMDPSIATRWLDTAKYPDAGWGIFEWHPRPGLGANKYADSARRYSSALLAATIGDLTKYNDSRCRALFPGWWDKSGDSTDMNWAIFALPNSNFAVGIKTWRDTVDDVPFPDRGRFHSADYAAPIPVGLRIDSTGNVKNRVAWSSRLWADRSDRVSSWRGHGVWCVQWSADGRTWSQDTTRDSVYRVPLAKGSVRLRLESSSGVPGIWSTIGLGASGTIEVGMRQNPSIDRIGDRIVVHAPDEAGGWNLAVYDRKGRAVSRAAGEPGRDAELHVPGSGLYWVVSSGDGHSNSVQLLVP